MMGLNTPAEHPVERAARLAGFPVPAGFVARPKRWQHAGFRRVETVSSPPPEPPGTEVDAADAESALETDQGQLSNAGNGRVNSPF